MAAARRADYDKIDVPMLYAWVRPLGSDPEADHTWVTSYEADTPPNRYPDIDAVRQAKESYWYCAGGYYATGCQKHYPEGLIGTVPRNMDGARAICRDNDDQAHKAILRYGVDGICHQVANRVLASAGRSATTVNLARRYWISSFAYGTYGRNIDEWESCKAKCGIRTLTVDFRSPAEKFEPPVDEFERHFYDVLGRYAELAPLRALRERLGAALKRTGDDLPHLGREEGAARLNSAINEHLKEAAVLLDPQEYRRVFGELPGSEARLVDPAGLS